MDEWSVVYEKAIRDDGSLLFPERLSKEFLDSVRRTMGSYIFSNQYQNTIIPDDAKVFKKEWLKYFETLPELVNYVAFIDPAIGQKNHNDYTGICVLATDVDGVWYVVHCERYRLTPSQTVNKCFELFDVYPIKCLGVESVAYQEALIYLLDQEMRLRRKVLPIKSIKRGSASKESRILALVPRFEWSRLYIRKGMTNLEDEISTFPRGRFDDLLDSMASCEEIVSYPTRPIPKPIEKPRTANDPNFELWAMQNKSRQLSQENNNDY